jgi:hypothetical protein
MRIAVLHESIVSTCRHLTHKGRKTEMNDIICKYFFLVEIDSMTLTQMTRTGVGE